MRLYLRTGRGSGVSVGIIGALVPLLVAAVAWTMLAAIVAVVLVVAAVQGVVAVIVGARKLSLFPAHGLYPLRQQASTRSPPHTGVRG